MGQFMLHCLQITDLVQNSHKCIFLGAREAREKHVQINPTPTPLLKKLFSVCALPLMAYSSHIYSFIQQQIIDFFLCCMYSFGIFIIIDLHLHH